MAAEMTGRYDNCQCSACVAGRANCESPIERGLLQALIDYTNANGKRGLQEVLKAYISKNLAA